MQIKHRLPGAVLGAVLALLSPVSAGAFSVSRSSADSQQFHSTPAPKLFGDLHSPRVGFWPAVDQTSLTAAAQPDPFTDPVPGKPSQPAVHKRGAAQVRAAVTKTSAPEPSFYLLTGGGLAVLLAMALRRSMQNSKLFRCD